MNTLPTPVFVALIVAATGVAAWTIPGAAIGAAYLIGRRVRTNRAGGKR